MKKFYYLMVCLALLWMVKLSFDNNQTSKSLESLQNDLHQSEQNNANLNDKIVALQRAIVTDQPKQETKNTEKNNQQQNTQQLNGSQQKAILITPTVLVRQQLDLIQFAISQQQYVLALDKMSQLQQNIEHYDLADTLKHSLLQAINKDKASIQQFVVAQRQQQDMFDETLNQIDLALTREIQSKNLNPAKLETKHFWQKWFQIDSVSEAPVDLMYRKVVLKEIQFRVLLAKNALFKGQVTEFQNNLDLAIDLFKQLPDSNSQRIKNKIEKLRHLEVLPTPKLNAIALLG
ncbi:hypothetical protein RFI36_19900 [Acinetobacter gerneri]|uniref:BSD domain-containing protein n=1 Tax=Acinetobacter gerneri TaxID=202952 RepID=A0AAW8JN33_9GAMM|nr:hypothetical protein [Acinetobacter gerneri]MDQ9011975.1 hypothetical protein [Acinetobacter gerneri]MDQ9016076.1 hypothetical protein [Acinetobacter gerneri]MDQ9027251.1 hypothetical protein [Acinetobacter gerneri]MDQ9054551.1 hypothetical protein [Acinetobacter gerneri]MDQ9062198.1 hypothetical protein [Acinetobacter gerneri]